MKIFAVSDLHLPGGDDKPMNVFGPHWEGHFEKISRAWRDKITDDDVTLIAGDISWAMQLENAAEDLRAIGALPGKKILLRGNHDYWWSSVTRVRDQLPHGMYVVQNDAMRIGDTAFCGTRLWTEGESEEDRKIYRRELMRLEMSLQAAEKLKADKLVVMTHYPPVTENGEVTEASRILSKYPVNLCIYGHLHGRQTHVFNGETDGVRYLCTSCDKIGFEPIELEV